ncbi:hypothetical protein ABFX02_06G049500 [Erythranthe guttata]
MMACGGQYRVEKAGTNAMLTYFDNLHVTATFLCISLLKIYTFSGDMSKDYDGHIILIIGYEIDKGERFYIIQNSWDKSWASRTSQSSVQIYNTQLLCNWGL